jgi:hypothetical protein
VKPVVIGKRYAVAHLLDVGLGMQLVAFEEIPS